MADKIGILDLDKPISIANGRLPNAFAKTFNVDDGNSLDSCIHPSLIQVQATTAQYSYRIYRILNNNDSHETNPANNAYTTTRDNNPINPRSPLPRQEKSTAVLHRRCAIDRQQQQGQGLRSRKLPPCHHGLSTRLHDETDYMATTTDHSLVLACMTKLDGPSPWFRNRGQPDLPTMKNEGNMARLETILEEEEDEEREEEHEERGRVM